MIEPTQTCINPVKQDELTVASTQMPQTNQAMRQLKLDELGVVVGGPIVGNNVP